MLQLNKDKILLRILDAEIAQDHFEDREPWDGLIRDAMTDDFLKEVIQDYLSKNECPFHEWDKNGQFCIKCGIE